MSTLPQILEQAESEEHWSKNDALLQDLLPNEEQLSAAAELICNKLNKDPTVECGNVVSFKLDYTGDVVTHGEQPTSEPEEELHATVKPMNQTDSEWTLQVTLEVTLQLDQEESEPEEELRATEKGVEHVPSEGDEHGTFSRTALMEAGRSGVIVPFTLCALGLLFTASATVKVVSAIHRRKQPEEGKPTSRMLFDNPQKWFETAPEEAKDAADDKKPHVNDDTASTATPVSVAESATSDEDLTVVDV
jgi:hypothetical protein